MFKVNNNDTRTTSSFGVIILVNLRVYFTTIFSAFIIDFEHKKTNLLQKEIQ